MEDRLRAQGLTPQTIGRSVFSSDRPLKAIKECMDGCSGTVVKALERKFFPAGIEKRGGPKQESLPDVKFPTPWNQIEAAMSYDRGIPLMVICEDGLREEGLLERGNDSYVPELASLNSLEFNGVLADWKRKVQHRKAAKPAPTSARLSGGRGVAHVYRMVVHVA